MELDDDLVQEILDELTNKYHNLPGFISVSEEEGRKGTYFKITVKDQRIVNVPKIFKYTSKNIEIDVNLRVDSGLEIIPYYYVYKNKKELKNDLESAKPIAIGGDKIWHNKLGGYGTLSFTAKKIMMKNRRKKCEGSNVCISNNHVLAMWDEADKGDPISTPWHNPFASLYCWFKVTKTANPNDLALGKIIDIQNTTFGAIRSIGTITGAIDAKKGMKVRKYGARTNLTKGKVKGLANIKVKKSIFNGVRKLTKGFSCAGDSGSAVLTDSLKVVGFVFAGEKKPCDQKPYSYFIPIIKVVKNDESEFSISFEI